MFIFFSNPFTQEKFSQDIQARKLEEGWSNQEILEHVEKGSAWCGLWEKGSLKAFILFHQVEQKVEITYLETQPEFRGQGLMEKLMYALIDHFPGNTIWLDVHAENQAARGLYEKLGFKRNGLRKGYYRDGGDCLLMQRASTL